MEQVLIWHGLSDQLIFPEGTIDYHERVVDKTGGLKETQNFARLFLAQESVTAVAETAQATSTCLLNWSNGSSQDRHRIGSLPPACRTIKSS